MLDIYPYATTSPVYLEGFGPRPDARQDAAYFVTWLDRVIEAARARSDDYNDEREKQSTLDYLEQARAPTRRLRPATLLVQDGTGHHGGAGSGRRCVSPVALEQLDQPVVWQRRREMPVRALHVARGHHRVHDGFLGRLHGRDEHGIEVVVAERLRLDQWLAR